METYEKIHLSDKNFKRNIEPLNNSLENLNKINGVYYEWDTDKYPSFSKGKQIGLIAQEVKEIYPELVKGNEDSKLSLIYDKIVAILIESIKDLDKKYTDEINKLHNIIDDLSKRI